MAEMPRLGGTLSPERRRLLEQMLRARGIEPPERRPPIPRARRDAPLSLSSAQQRLWFLEQLTAGANAYADCYAIRFDGLLDVPALEQALSEVVRRHEALRTTFGQSNGRPTQIVHTAGATSLDVEDFTWCPASERDDVMQDVALEETKKPLSLDQGPLLRTRLIRYGAEEHRLLLVMHHIVSDGQSYLILFRELAALYGAFTDGLPSPLPEPVTQLADYAAWEQQRLSDGILEPQLDFWRRQLADSAGVVAIPTDRPRPPVQTYRGAGATLELKAELGGLVDQVCRRDGLTPYMLLLSAFQVLLASYSEGTNIVVGAPVANRSYPGSETVFGFLVNTIVLRVDLSGNPPLGEVMLRTRDACLAAFANQDVPFDAVVQALRVKRDLGSSPLFQTCVVEQMMSERVEAGGVTMTDLVVDYGVARFDLALWIIRFEAPTRERGSSDDQSPRLTLRLQYNTDIFLPDTVRRMLGELETVATHLVASAATPMAAVIALLREARNREADGMSVSVRQPDADTGVTAGARRVHDLFNDQAGRSPQAIAVVCGEQQLSYEELDARATDLAHRLRTAGVSSGMLVALCCERSVEMIVGILGILKAGAAYVPLDPSYPGERIAFVLDDSKAQVLVTQGKYLSTLPDHGARTILLDEVSESISRQGSLPEEGSADDAAYVIYTSGSTGKPKAVVISHANLMHSNAARLEFYRESVGCYLLLSSFAFDSSVAGIFWTLTDGGTLVIPEEGAERDPRLIVELIARHHVSHTLTLPSFYKLLLAEGAHRNQLGSLRTVIVAGETCRSELVGRHFREMPAAELYNEYGPTEGTVWCTAHRCVPEDANAPVPIGRPIPRTSIFLLDADMMAVPHGENGELYIGGPGVASGYLRRPDLTRDRFVPDPFGSDPSARLYRSGDLARSRDDGAIEFLGRVDQQVKIRGYRVELGEIESALAEHAAVRECAVILRQDAENEPRLVAYVVGAEDVAPGAGGLRRFLSGRLPDYMIPAVFVMVDAMPMTPTGKVDRNALPAPESARPELESQYIAPRTALERLLAENWSDVLGIQSIGVDDNFFELGGNSIQAAILINRLQATLGEYIHVATVFREPRIAGFARMLTAQYPSAVAAAIGAEGMPEEAARQQSVVGVEDITRFRRLIPPLPARSYAANGESPNPPALFILSPPRSGSTLLRVMVAGHPRLFVPPELELLNFNTMAERGEEFVGENRYLGEGLVRAVMQMENCDAASAQAMVDHSGRTGKSTREFYKWMQEQIGQRLLVDKTAVYSIDLETLRRAEYDFSEARYVHLVRHPLAMIRSFEKVHLDQVFFRHEHPFTPRQLAELLWVVCNQNIASLLREVPAQRQCRVRFEDLVSRPEATMRALCDWLDVPFVTDMLRPYDEPGVKMTDATSPHSRMQGDPVFHKHTEINRDTAEQWRQTGSSSDALGVTARHLADELGYGEHGVGDERVTVVESPSAQPVSATGSPGLDVGELSDEQVRAMLDTLLSSGR